MVIADILHHQQSRPVVKALPADTVQDVVRKLAEFRIGAVVVEDAWMRPVGIFSERDFVRAVSDHGAVALAMRIEAFMSKAIVSCRPTDRVEAALATMTLARIRHLPVLDAGKLVGIVSIGDLVKHRLDQKELEANVLLERARMLA